MPPTAAESSPAPSATATATSEAKNIACELTDIALFKQQTGTTLKRHDQNVVGRSSNCMSLWPVPEGETGGAYGVHVTADIDLVKLDGGTLSPYILGGGGVSTTVTADRKIILQDDPGPSPTRLIAGIPCAAVDSFRACRYKDYTLLFYPGTKGLITDVLVESALLKAQSGLL